VDYILFGYQVVPGSDEILSFSATQGECEAAALEQRRDIRANDPRGADDLTGMAVYRFIIRPMTAVELVRVMNGEASVHDIAAIDRRLVALIAD
jgi:hypothetical protein